MTDTGAPEERQIENPAGDREKHKVSGDRVVAKIKELLHEGNVRHIVIKNDEGRTLIEFPVSRSCGLLRTQFCPLPRAPDAGLSSWAHGTSSSLFLLQSRASPTTSDSKPMTFSPWRGSSREWSLRWSRGFISRESPWG